MRSPAHATNPGVTIAGTMPETTDESVVPSGARAARGASAPDDLESRDRRQYAQSTQSIDLSVVSLADQLRRNVSGQWTDNRLLQSQHDDGITYLALNSLMTAIRSSTVTVTRKRKQIARDSLRTGLVTKALSTPGAHAQDEKWEPFDDDDHPLVRLIARPNSTETINDLLAQMIQQVMLTGSALMWANPSKRKLPAELYILPTALCLAQPPSPIYPSGYWTVTQYYPSGGFGMLPYPGAGGGVPVDARQIFRIRNDHPLWRWDALSPLTAGAVQLSILEAIDTARFSAMENGLTSDAFILAPGAGQEQINAWLEQLRQANAGKRNHRKMTILGGEVGDNALKVQFPHVSAKEMDYTGGWDQMTAFALALFGVPKAIAGLDSATSYATLFASQKQFYTLTLQPWAARIGQWLTHHLAHMWGPEFAIQVDVPTIDDKDQLNAKINQMAQNSAITVNEIRGAQGFPHVEDGDVIPAVYAQLQMQKHAPELQPGQPGAEQGPGEQLAPGEPTDTTAPPVEEVPDDGAEPVEEESHPTEDEVLNAALEVLGIEPDAPAEGAEPGDESPVMKMLERYIGKAVANPFVPSKPGGGKTKTKTERKHPPNTPFKTEHGWFVTNDEGHTTRAKDPNAATKSASKKLATAGDDEADRVAWDSAAPKKKPAADKLVPNQVVAEEAAPRGPSTKPKLKAAEQLFDQHSDDMTAEQRKATQWLQNLKPADREEVLSRLKAAMNGKPVRALQWNTLESRNHFRALARRAQQEFSTNFIKRQWNPRGESLESYFATNKPMPAHYRHLSNEMDSPIATHFLRAKELWSDKQNAASRNLGKEVDRAPIVPTLEPAKVASAAAKVSAAAPGAKEKLANPMAWVPKQVAKHRDTVAIHFNITPEKAERLLTQAMMAVAKAAHTGSFTIHDGKTGKTATLNRAGAAKTPPSWRTDPPLPESKVGPLPPLSLSGADADEPPAPDATGRLRVPEPRNPAAAGSLAPAAPRATPPVPTPSGAGESDYDTVAPARRRRKTGGLRATVAKSHDGEHEYGCVLIPITGTVRDALYDVAAMIHTESLADEGREENPHVTVLYGLTDADPEDVQDVLASSGSVPLALSGYGYFEGDDHDVVYVRVVSPPLRALHDALCELPHEVTHPTYTPHVTLAYVKPGTGRHWAESLPPFEARFVSATAVYSDRNEEESAFDLTGYAKAPMSALTETTGGALVGPPQQTRLITLKRPRVRRRRLARFCKSVLDEMSNQY